MLHAHEDFYYIKRAEGYKYWLENKKLKQVIIITETEKCYNCYGKNNAFLNKLSVD